MALTRNYTFVDYATQGYLALVALLLLVFHNQSVPEWPWLLAGHLVCLGMVHWLLQAYARCDSNRVVSFLRHFYPILFYTAFYRETGALNHMFLGDYLDPLLIEWEQRIFGCQPSLILMEEFPYLWVSEPLYASYFSYYLMISGVGVALFIQDRRHFFHYVSVVSFVFYLCYLTYIFLPVMGPRVFFREIEGYQLPESLAWIAANPQYPEMVTRGWFYQLMRFIYHNFEAPGAAFPSSHVAIALTTVFFSFRYLRRIRWIHLVVALLLCLSTVFCRYHYVIDVVAGVLTAACLVPLGDRLFWRFQRGRESKR